MVPLWFEEWGLARLSFLPAADQLHWLLQGGLYSASWGGSVSSPGTFQGQKKLAGDELAEVLLEKAEGDDPEVLQGGGVPQGIGRAYSAGGST